MVCMSRLERARHQLLASAYLALPGDANYSPVLYNIDVHPDHIRGSPQCCLAHFPHLSVTRSCRCQNWETCLDRGEEPLSTYGVSYGGAASKGASKEPLSRINNPAND